MRSLLTALLRIAPLAHGSVTRAPPAPRPAAPEPGVHVRGRWVDGCLRKGPFLFAVGRPASECR